MSSAQSGLQAATQLDASPFEVDPRKGRDFREISVHPNGQELLFTECVYDPNLDPAGDCYVLRYQLTTKNLQRYALPAGYVYSTASFSPQGNYVLMSRVPKIGVSEEKVRQAYENSEIVLMKTDGTDFKVLPLAKGDKVAPIMSPDETRVAYWRSTVRPPGSKSFSSQFDMWEVNLNTGQDSLYAGPFIFFERSRLQYLSQDELLVGAWGPKEYAQSMTAYEKKYNNSSVYRIQRGMTTLPEPILTEVVHAGLPSVDNTGNLYFKGERPGLSLFRKTVQGEIEQWMWPVRYSPGEWGGGPQNLVIDPSGSYIAFTYEIKGTYSRDHKRGIGLLITHTSEWRILNIPSLHLSAPIAVKAANSKE